MTDSNELRDALRIAVPVEPEEKVAERRAALLSVIEREIYSTPKRIEQEQKRRSWRRSGRILAVAAALLGTLGLGMLVSEFEAERTNLSGGTLSTGSATTGQKSAEVLPAHLSLAGQSYETGAGHEKVLQMAGATKVTLAANTRVFVQRDSDNQQHLSLSSGAVLLSVPEHRKHRSVQVQTAHATVQVTGTIFGVEVGRFSQPAGTPLRTRVSVERGQVVVQHAAGRVVLEPGDTWLSPLQQSPLQQSPLQLSSANSPSADRASPTLRPNEPRGAEQATAGVASKSTAPRVRNVTQEQVPRATTRRMDAAALPTLAPERARAVATAHEELESPSTLAAQNNLLEKALSAEKQGDRVHAAELIERFLQRYPRSPLRASALAIKKRLY